MPLKKGSHKMKRNRLNSGFSLVELLVVLTLFIIGIALAVYTFQNRTSHFKLRGRSRELLGAMKLAQSSAIRSNQRYRIRFLNGAQSYDFQIFSPTAGDFVAVGANEGRLAETYDLQDDKINVQNIVYGGTNCTVPCFSPQFNADGTLNPNGSLGLTDGHETQSLTWTIGGAVRIQ